MSKKVKRSVRISLSEEDQLKKRLATLEQELDQQELVIEAAEKKIIEAVKELDQIEAKLCELTERARKS